MKKVLLMIICSILLFTGCKNIYNNESGNNNRIKNTTTQNNDNNRSDEKVSDIKVTINDVIYTLELENNNTVEEFLDLLPQEYIMSELNGNEKYVYLDKSLTTNTYNPKHIEKGDVMLFGNNCLVLFYESFDTSYHYTKIGHIDNITNLGNGNITVKFEK